MEDFYEKYMLQAIELSKNCNPAPGAYSVGAIICNNDGQIISTGYSRETSDSIHAEEVAINKAKHDQQNLSNCIIFSSMEPCSKRKSSPTSCSELIIQNQISTVVFAYREPSLFVDCQGAELLKAKGVNVIEFHQYANLVIDINQHLLKN